MPKSILSRLQFWQKNPPIQEPKPKRKRPSHAGGHIYTQEEIEDHKPLFGIVPFDPATGKPQLTAAQGKTVFSKHYVNIMSDLDHLALESLINSTVLGPLSQTLVRFFVGNGLSPQVKLLNEDDLTAEQKETELEKYKYVLDALNKITAKIDRHNDVSWEDTITQLVQQTVDYGRGCILFDDFTNPKKVMLVQSRDMGITEVDDFCNFESVQFRFMNSQISKDDLVYLYNPIQTSQTYNAGVYGIPMLKPCIDSARALRKIPKDLEKIATNSYAGSYLLTIKNQGQTQEDKESEYQQITRHFKPEGVNVLVEAPEDVKTETVNWSPEFEGLIKSGDYLKKDMIQALGLPMALLDESVSNRASLLGKIQLTLKVQMLPVRELLSRQITRQFYQRHFERLYPDLVDKIKIVLHFQELQISTWIDLMQAALSLDSRAQLTNQAMSELIGLQNYESMIEPNAEVTPGGQNHDLPKEGFDNGN